MDFRPRNTADPQLFVTLSLRGDEGRPQRLKDTKQGMEKKLRAATTLNIVPPDFQASNPPSHLFNFRYLANFESSCLSGDKAPPQSHKDAKTLRNERRKSPTRCCVNHRPTRLPQRQTTPLSSSIPPAALHIISACDARTFERIPPD